MKFLHCAFAIRIAMVKRGFPHWNCRLAANYHRHETGRVMVRMPSFIRESKKGLRTDFTDQLATRLGCLRQSSKKFLVGDASGDGQCRSRFLAPNFSIGIA